MNREQALALFSPYESIIFDYGGIFFDLDFQNTARAFAALNPEIDFHTLFAKHSQIEIFNQFEMGKITIPEFISELRTILRTPQVSDQSILDAWCAMLLTVKKERIDFLKELKKTKRLFLLSNINEIHEKFAESYLQEHGLNDFYTHFEHVYFSHRMGLRKPDPEIFKRVLQEQKLPLEKTIFLDDSIQHVEGARSIGLAAHHLEVSNTFLI